MTFNLRSDSIFDGKNRWHKRNNIVFDVIKKYNCDIIGLQEVTNKMYKDIEEQLSDYYIIGQPRCKRFFVEHNNILISKRHEILEEETFWLSNQPKKVGSSIWYSVFPRICTTAKVRLDSGELVRIYNTHLDVYLSPARGYGLKKISEYIERQQEIDQIPVVLMGDFNATPNHRIIKTFTEGELSHKRFVAVQEYDKSIYNKPTMGRFKDSEKGMHLDYIFVSEECAVLHAEIIKDNVNGQYPSDHYPLLAHVHVTLS